LPAGFREVARLRTRFGPPRQRPTSICVILRSQRVRGRQIAIAAKIGVARRTPIIYLDREGQPDGRDMRRSRIPARSQIEIQQGLVGLPVSGVPGVAPNFGVRKMVPVRLLHKSAL
jgi:hypothetical protein